MTTTSIEDKIKKTLKRKAAKQKIKPVKSLSREQIEAKKANRFNERQ